MTCPAVNPTVTSFLYTLPTISRRVIRLIGERVRIMLRLKILASAVPLLVAAVFARGDLLPGARP